MFICISFYSSYQVENDFILPLEKEMFIEQLKDIVDKAEDMLSEDTEGERNSDPRGSPKQSEGAGILGTEVRKKLLTRNGLASALVPPPRIYSIIVLYFTDNVTLQN